MKRTGELLRKSREEKGLSVHEVGLFLKINPRILQAIEEGDQTQLPAKTFLRGFIQSYAKFLKLDSQEVLHIFSEETAISPRVENVSDVQLPTVGASTETTAALEKAELSQSAPENDKKKPEPTDADSLKNSILTKSTAQSDALRVRTFAISVIGLILVFAIYFVNSVIKKYQREGEIATDIKAPVEPSASDSSISNKSTEVTANPAKEESQSPNSNSGGVTSNTGAATNGTTPPVSPNSSEPAVAAAAAHTQKPTAPSAAPASGASAPSVTAPPTSVTPPTAASKPNSPAPAAPIAEQKPALPGAASATATASITTSPSQPAPKVPEGKLTEVIVEANQNVEIEYSSNKSSPQKLALKADQVHTFKSRSGVKLKISNGGAVNIIVNGQDRGAPGAAGQAIQVAYE